MAEYCWFGGFNAPGKMRFRIIITIMIVFLSLPALADDCAQPTGDIAIAACTRNINSGKFKGHVLAVSYYYRGNEYENKDDIYGAIADYNQAISIDPKYAIAYNNRGSAYYKKGDVDRAITDYNQAIGIDSKSRDAYNNRGNAYFKKRTTSTVPSPTTIRRSASILSTS